MPYLAELVKEVAKFEKSKLAKAKTTEKDILPDSVGNYIIEIAICSPNYVQNMEW